MGRLCLRAMHAVRAFVYVRLCMCESLRMYECVYVWICIYVCVCVFVHICGCIYMCIRVCMSVCMCMICVWHTLILYACVFYINVLECSGIRGRRRLVYVYFGPNHVGGSNRWTVVARMRCVCSFRACMNYSVVGTGNTDVNFHRWIGLHPVCR